MNNYIKEIVSNNIHIASLVKPLSAEPGLNFCTHDNKFIQAGIWKYKKGKILQTHFHNEFERVSMRTCESVIVLKGKIKCNLYHENGDYIDSFEISQNEMIIQFNGAHEYEILEDAIVVENKNGPYFGPEIDRTRI